MVEVARKTYWYESWIFAATAASLSLLVIFPYALRGRTEGILHPHGFCYIWDPVLVWSHVSADLLIGGAYVAIALTLGYFVYRVRHLLPFHWMFLAFGLFILTCGATHIMDVWTLWFADFWASAALKIVTAVASVATAIALPPLVPEAVRLLHAANVSEDRREQLALARRQQQLAEEENRAKDQFLATLSHELRTPLNAIAGWSQVLQSVSDHGSQAAKAVAAIQRNAALQTRLIEDLLDVSSIIAGRLRVARGPVDLTSVVRDAVDATRPVARDRGLTLSWDLPADPVYIEGDAARLRQVVDNLLSNAVKFTDGPEGAIDVALRSEKATAILTVRDTGIGIHPDLLPRVFDRFVQADQTSTRARGGLGLGLAIVRHLVEAHGGSAAVHSEGLGRGAVFEVRLPLA